MTFDLPAGKYVVAVSGGVDSVVLLDILSKKPGLELIVAHFDHGIRDDSAQDADFVKSLAEKYHLRFEMRREELGPGASEELARARRYLFLKEMATKFDGGLITAHHNDDVIETVAINLLRGTGWRGLAVLDSGILRPLTDFSKLDILDYAKKQNLTWHEDSTNQSDKYLRNRIRRQAYYLESDAKKQLTELWKRQKYIKKLIDDETARLIGDELTLARYLFINIDDLVAIELLRRITRARLTRPQMVKSLYMIKTALPGRVHYAGNGVKISFASRNFTIEVIK